MSNITPTEKDFATVRAQFALKGYQLIRADQAGGSHDYLVNRWGWTRYLTTWPQVLVMLEQIGGAA